MDTISAAMTERRSMRWAPSAGNSQSTTVFVVRGNALERVKAVLLAAADPDFKPSADIESAPNWPDPYKARMEALFKTRSEYVAANSPAPAVGDPPPNPMAGMAGLWGAPVLLLLVIPPGFGQPYGCYDAGLLSQSIALAAHGRGLGTCLMTAPLRASADLHEALPETAGFTFVAAITLGYPDGSAPVNNFPRTRVGLEEFVTYLS
jgi:nitroreductase